MSEPVKQARGTVYVRMEVCKGCSFCIDFCPTHCIEFSKEYNAKGYHFPVLSRPVDCTGCDMCGSYCPDFAIFGIRLKDLEERKKQAKLTASLPPNRVITPAAAHKAAHKAA